MPKKNPPAADSAGKPGIRVPRVRRVGDIDALREKHWSAVTTAWRLMKQEGATVQQQLSAIHALNQASGAYVKLLEQTDLKRELEALREELLQLRKSEGLRKVA